MRMHTDRSLLNAYKYAFRLSAQIINKWENSIFFFGGNIKLRSNFLFPQSSLLYWCRFIYYLKESQTAPVMAKQKYIWKKNHGPQLMKNHIVLFVRFFVVFFLKTLAHFHNIFRHILWYFSRVYSQIGIFSEIWLRGPQTHFWHFLKAGFQAKKNILLCNGGCILISHLVRLAKTWVAIPRCYDLASISPINTEILETFHPPSHWLQERTTYTHGHRFCPGPPRYERAFPWGPYVHYNQFIKKATPGSDCN